MPSTRRTLRKLNVKQIFMAQLCKLLINVRQKKHERRLTYDNEPGQDAFDSRVVKVIFQSIQIDFSSIDWFDLHIHPIPLAGCRLLRIG